MKIKPMFLLLVTCLFMLATLAADQPRPREVVHIQRAAVDAAFAKGAPLLITNNFKVQTGRRTEAGEVEIHASDTDVFYILDGSATFVTGGKPVESRTIAPGETRARSITGGEERKLAKGDVIVIPKGIPHWFSQVNGLLLYYVVKVTEP